MDNLLVKDYIKSSPLQVSEEDCVCTILNLMKKHSMQRVIVVSSDNCILGSINSETLHTIVKNCSNLSILKEMKVKDIIQGESPMVFYPRMSIMDAYNTMKCFNINQVPVADVPWEKRIIGFLCLDDILPIIRKNNLKVSF